jgi:hypothetical protein
MDRYDQAARRRKLRARAVAALGGKCLICGYDKCHAALDFHHVEARTKDLEISAGTSWKRIEAELPKCLLLCATCHREVHDGLHPEYITNDASPPDDPEGLYRQLELF